MKTTRCLLPLLAVLTFSATAQLAPPGLANGEADGGDPWQIVSRGPHERVWSRVIWETNALGKAVGRTSSFEELQTGMNVLQPNGTWVEASEEIEITGAVAVARKGRHRVTFSANCNSPVAINMLAADGKRFRSRVLGLSYLEKSSGKSVLIAQVKDSVGQLLPPNQVIYIDAFTGFMAHLRYTYTKAGLEQDVILRERPPAPEAYGLDPNSTVLQILTEFFSPPAPQKSARLLPGTNGLVDETLDFGDIQIQQGRAFSVLGDTQDQHSIPVGKSWTKLEGRDFLIEEVAFPSLQSWLDALPVPRTAAVKPNGSVDSVPHRVSTQRLPPIPKSDGSTTDVIQLAQTDPVRSPAVIWDYSALSTTAAKTLLGDTTYYVSGAVNLSGTTTIEGGTVVKFASGTTPKINITGTVDCKTGAYRPAIFTAKDDNSIGETISGSSGNPGSTKYGSGLTFSTSGMALNYLRFSYANTALSPLFSVGQISMTNMQFINCSYPIDFDGNSEDTVFADNCLFYSFTYVFKGGYDNIFRGQHLTANQGTKFAATQSGGSGELYLTNCLLVAITGGLGSLDVISTDHSPSISSANGVFQTVGGGTHYLANDNYRYLGTTTITPSLLAALKNRTTYPPIELTSNFTVDTTLAPRAQRDTDTDGLDYGYHYDPLDYYWTSLNLSNAKLILTDGVAIGNYGSKGTWLKNGAQFISEGKPTVLNRLVRYNTVQENPWGTTSSVMSLLNVTEMPAVLPKVQLRFTDISLPADSTYKRLLLDNNGDYGIESLTLKDCQVRGGALLIDLYPNSDSRIMTVGLTNNVIQRAYLSMDQDTDWDRPRLIVHLRNNLVLPGTMAVNDYTGTATWTARDNLFHNVSLGLESVLNDWNGYIGIAAKPGGTHNKSSLSPDFQPGPAANWYGVLGNYYYLPSGSLNQLIDAGSRSATEAGLFHYTVKTSNLREGDEPPGTGEPPEKVDIGFHYVAVNPSTGLPYDIDADGTPDCMEGPPVITLPGNPTYTEDLPPVRLSPTATLIQCIAPNGGNLRVSMDPSPFLTEILSIQPVEGISLGYNSVPGGTGDEGQPLPDTVTSIEVLYNSKAFGIVTGGSGNALVINFYAASTDPLTTMAATPSAVLALIHSLAYKDTSQNPISLTRNVVVTLNEADGRSGSATRVVNIVAVNDPPFVTFFPGRDFKYVRGSKAVVRVDENDQATVTDLDSTVWDGGSLIAGFETTASSAEEIIAVRNQGTGPGQISVSGTEIRYGNETAAFGTITSGTPGATLNVTFYNAATLTKVQALVRNLTYQNTSAIGADTGRGLYVQLKEGPGPPEVTREGPKAYKAVHMDCPNRLEVMLVVDRSGSMAGQSLNDAKDAAANLLNFLGPTVDRVGLVKFSSAAEVDQSLTHDFNLVRNKIVTLTASGATAIGAAISAAWAELAASPRFTTAGSVIVLLSDGANNTGVSPGAAAEEARKRGIRLITVALGAAADPALSSIASRAEDFYTANSGSDLCAKYAAIGQSLCRASQLWVDAGPDQTVFTGSASLAASVNGDLCGATLAWSTLSGVGSATLTPANAARAHVDLNHGPGRYVLQFSATKNGTTWSDQVAVTWVENRPPVVDAGPDRILNDNTPTPAFTIIGTATDDWTSSDDLKYEWSKVSAPAGFTISTPPGRNLDVPAGLAAGEYVFLLSVTDKSDAIGIDYVTNRVVPAGGRTWTRNADFEEGYMANVDYDQTPDSLTLSAKGTSSRLSGMFSRSGDHHDHSYAQWLARIDTGTGQTVGWHAIGGDRHSSCTATDFHPEFWARAMLQLPNGDTIVVGGAGFATGEGGGYYYAPSILRFGTVIGGTRVNASGLPDQTIAGEYLAPPFKYSTCVDRNNDGKLKVSRGLDQNFPWCVRPIANAFATVEQENDMLQAAEDEAIVQFHLLRQPSNPELLAVDNVIGVAADSLGNIWVSGVVNDSGSGYDTIRLLRLDPDTLLVTEIVDPDSGSGGWPNNLFNLPQSQMGPNDTLYVSRLDSPNTWGAVTANTMPRVTHRGTGPTLAMLLPWARPAFAINPRNGSIWYLNWDDSTKLIRLDPNSVDPISGEWSKQQINHGFPPWPNAGPVTIDANDDVWFAPTFGLAGNFPVPTVSRFGDNGQLVGYMQLACLTLQPTSFTWDGQGRLWLCGRSDVETSRLVRIDPKRGPVSAAVGRAVGAVDRAILGPVSYAEDGILCHDASQQLDRAVGTWTAVHDGGSNIRWGAVSWHATIDSGSSIKVQARAAASQPALASQPWTPIANNGDTLDAYGQWIEVRVTFKRGTGNVSPKLDDLTVLPFGAADVSLPASGQIAVDDEFSTTRNSVGSMLEASFDVLANDKAASGRAIQTVSLPRHGITRINGNLIGYTPDADFWGEDRFVYTVIANDGIIDRGLVKVSVSPSPAAPVGQPQSDPDGTYTTFTNTYGPANVAGDCKGSSPASQPHANRDILTIPARVSADTSEYAINVLANDTPAGQIALIDDFPRATGFGHVHKNGNLIYYQPSVGAYGTDVFSYRITDNQGAESSGTVVVQVAPLTPPSISGVVTDPSSPVPQSPTTPVTITIRANVTPGEVDTSIFGGDWFTGLSTMNYFDNPPGSTASSVTLKVVKVEFFDGTKKLGEKFTADAGIQWSWLWNHVNVGTHSITVVATDEIGSVVVSAPLEVTVNGPAGPPNGSPIATLTGFNSSDTNNTPADALAVLNRYIVNTGHPTLLGTVGDNDSVGSASLSYQILLYRADGTLAGNVTPGSLTAGYASVNRPASPPYTVALSSALDLTAYANGGYELELLVSDGLDETVSSRLPFVLRTGLKIGQFAFQEQDAVVATPGLPLTIVRSYNSSQPWDGDFGHGWTYAINDLDVEINETREEFKDAFSDESFSLRTGGGWDVTLTLPDGRRTTFAYQITPAAIPYGHRLTWVPEPGVTATPNPQTGESFGDNLIFALSGSPPLTYWQAGGPACPLENFDMPQLVLTLQDGTKYTIQREDFGKHDVELDPGHFIHAHAYGKPRVSKVERPNGLESIEITPDGVIHKWGSQVTHSLVLERGPNNRVIAVRNEEGLTANSPALVRYQYDGQGNLTHVLKLVDKSNPLSPIYETTTYLYENHDFPHYITKILDARGIEVARTEYEDDGKIKLIQDARGNRTYFTHKTETTDFAAPRPANYGTPIVREEIRFVTKTDYEAAGFNLDNFQATVHEADARGNVIYTKHSSDFETWTKYGPRTDLDNNDPHKDAWLQWEQQHSVTEQKNGSPVTRTYKRQWVYDGPNSLTAPAAQKLAPTKITDAYCIASTSADADEVTPLAKRRTTRMEYNALGQVTSTFDPLHSGVGSTVYQETRYDEIITSPTYGQVMAQYFHNPDAGADPRTPAGGQMLSENHYYPDPQAPSTIKFQGLLWYSLDAQNTATINEYYDGTSETDKGRCGDLKSVTVRAGGLTGTPLSKTAYTYNLLGNRLTEERVKFTVSGNTITETGRLITRYTYDAKGRVIQTTEPPVAPAPTGATSESVYNSLGQTASSTDRYNATTRYYYDSAGKLSQTVYPDNTIVQQAEAYAKVNLGTVGSPVWEVLRCQVVEDRHALSEPTANIIGTRTVYNSVGRVIRAERVKPLSIQVTPNGEARDTTYAFNPDTPADTANVLTRTLTEYLADGRVWKTTQDIGVIGTIEPSDLVTTNEYAPDGLSKTTMLPAVTDAISGHTITTKVIENYDLNGNLKDTQTKSYDNGTEMTYKPVTRFFYDQLNRRTNTFACNDESDQTGVSMGWSKHDWSGRAWLQVDADSHATAFVYDSAGQLAWVVTDVYTSPQTPATLPNPLPSTHADWVTWAKNGQTRDSTATQYKYNELGQQTEQVDARLNSSFFQYDDLGRRSRRYLPGNIVEYWTYDYQEAGDAAPPAGKRINKTMHQDFKTQQTLLVYDVAGRLDRKKAGATVRVDYDYTAAGQRARMLDNLDTASPRETRYVYDDRNRLRVKNTPEGTLTYSYDDARGSLLAISAQTAYGYFNTPPGPPYADFATVNATASAADTTRAKMTYTYDARNRLTTVNTDAAVYSYNSVGSQATMRYRNGVETAYTYNSRNQLTLMDSTRSGAVASFKYDDAAWGVRRLATSGLRRRMLEIVSGVTRTADYDYDNLNRLTQETINGTASVRYDGGTPVGGSGSAMNGYDATGNRLSRRSTVAGVPSTPNNVWFDVNDRLDNDSNPGTPSTYFDANGNTLKPDLNGDGVVDGAENAYTYGYDLENRLTSVNDGAGKTITMVYDGDGNRVKKVVDAPGTANDSTTTYLVDDRNPTGYAQVLEERDGSGNTLVTYVYGLDLVSQTRNTGTVGSPVWTTHYYGYDGLGTVRYLTDGSPTLPGGGVNPTLGAITDTYTYDGFGILIERKARRTTDGVLVAFADPASDTAPAGTLPANNFYRYTGEQWDADLGMYYLRARYYKPELGRFWTMDSYEGGQNDPLSLHKYLYCENNPLNGIDPTGQFTLLELLTVGSISTTLRAANELKEVAAKQAVTARIFEVYAGLQFTWENLPFGHSGIYVLNKLTRKGVFYDVQAAAPKSRLQTYNPFVTHKGVVVKQALPWSVFISQYPFRTRVTRMHSIHYIFWRASLNFLNSEGDFDAGETQRISFSLFGNIAGFGALAGEQAYSCHSWTVKAALSALIISKIK